MADTEVKGCHLVGSVNLADAEAVFRQACAGMPNRLRRIPDGETGTRHLFTSFQVQIFEAVPQLGTEFVYNAPIPKNSYSPEEIEDAIDKLKTHGIDTRYDEHAIESYQVFRRLRDEGVIPPGVRFQVSIPTAPNALVPFVQRAFISHVAPLYNEALYSAIRNIQDKIPHEDLAIQIDLAVDTAFWERANYEAEGKDFSNTGLEWYRAWFADQDVKEYIVSYICTMISKIDADVEVGLHNCYGDMDHRHWHEPTSLAAVVERGIRVIDRAPRPLNFFHCPVPKSAVDNLDAYLAPLKELEPHLQKNGTELYLGVVHEFKPEVTQKMIEAANKVVSSYGVSTECGLGRVEQKEIDDAFKISRDVSQAIV